jgi:uncharacterized lipoprotein YbaY
VVGVLYDGDKLKNMKKIGVGKGVRGRILLDHGVKTIGKLCCMTDEMKQIIADGGSMSDITLVTTKRRSIHTSLGMVMRG